MTFGLAVLSLQVVKIEARANCFHVSSSFHQHGYFHHFTNYFKGLLLII